MIRVQARRGPPTVASGLIQSAAEAALTHEAAVGDLTVVLAGDAQLQALNEQYLGVDAPTDVLAFPAADPDPDIDVPYLGDVLISVDRARAQAQQAGHPLESEVQLLVVHGVLHLLGHDHEDPLPKSRMWLAQAEVMEKLGLAGVIPSES